MKRNILRIFSICFLVLGCTPQKSNIEHPFATLTYGSNTNDSQIFWAKSPLPKPCFKTGFFVEFCTEPAPLKMDRNTYQALKDSWGIRSEIPARLAFLIETGTQTWNLKVHPEDEPPLIWKSDLEDNSFFIWPVEPVVPMTNFAVSPSVQWTITGARTLKITFSVQKNSSLIRMTRKSTHQWEWAEESWNKTRKILIDPGHGGNDTGAAKGNIVEKNINLEASTILAKALIANGFQAELTRTTDQELSLSDRVTLIEQRQPTLFLSIHHDVNFSPIATFKDGCFYGGNLRHFWCKLLTPMASGLLQTPKQSVFRSLALTLPLNTNNVLLELADLETKSDWEIIQDQGKREKFYQSWADNVARSLKNIP